MIKRICEICEKEFMAFPSEIRLRGARFCSTSCSSIYKARNRDITGENNPMYGKGLKGANNPMYGKYGESNPNWQGGRHIRKDGYVRITKQGKRYLEHRLETGCSPDLVVHHIDHNPSNNSINNLMVVTRVEHGRIHNGKS